MGNPFIIYIGGKSNRMKQFKCSKVKGGVIGAVFLCTTLYAFEGKINETYLDPVGILTACGGHTGSELRIGQTFTDEECNILMQKDASKAVDAINKYVMVDISEHTAVALVSFTYNVGVENFRKSTLLKKLNSGDLVGACNELPKWVYSKGKKLPGLVKRREKERELCLQF